MKSLWEKERERDKVGRPPRPLHFFDPAPKAMTKEADMGIRGHSSDLDDVEKCCIQLLPAHVCEGYVPMCVRTKAMNLYLGTISSSLLRHNHVTL